MQKALFKSTIIFSLFTILAQILAVLRDIVLVRFVGVGSMLDTYYLAFKIPDLLSGFYMIFLGSVVFIPIVTRAMKEGGEIEVAKKVSKIFTFIFGSILILSSLLFAFMPYIVAQFMSHLAISQQSGMISLSRILIISQLIFPIGIVAGAIAMVREKVAYVAVSSALYNLGIFLGAVFLYPIYGLIGLAFGVILGSILFTSVQIYPRVVRDIFLKIRFNFDFQTIKDFTIKNSYRFISVFSWQVFLLLLVYTASLYGDDYVSIWSIAYGLEISIISIIGVSVASILMPGFAKSHIDRDESSMKKDITNATIFTIWPSLVVAFIIFFTTTEFIKIIFYFSNLADIKAESIALIFSILILSLPMQNYFEILRKYLYARDMIKAVSSLMLIFMFSTLFFTFGIKQFVSLENKLMSLSLAFLFANIFSLSLFGFMYRKLDFIDYKKISLYLKSIFLNLFLTFFTFIFVLFAVRFLEINFLYANTFNFFIFKVLLLVSLIMLFAIALRDRVFLDLINLVKSNWKK